MPRIEGPDSGGCEPTLGDLDTLSIAQKQAPADKGGPQMWGQANQKSPPKDTGLGVLGRWTALLPSPGLG